MPSCKLVMFAALCLQGSLDDGRVLVPQTSFQLSTPKADALKKLTSASLFYPVEVQITDAG